MNAHLEQLMIEAGYAAPELAGRANKLAELIVRECADVANKWQTGEHPGLLVKDVITYHFGVEE
jgi:hypothetical protein